MHVVFVHDYENLSTTGVRVVDVHVHLNTCVIASHVITTHSYYIMYCILLYLIQFASKYCYGIDDHNSI